MFSPHNIYAQYYNEGVYGGGYYNNTPQSGSSGSSGGGSPSAPSCTSAPPSFAPDLFQINTNATSATLYFAPAGNPYDNYFVSFGNTSTAESYGGAFNLTNATGVISYSIYSLTPNTVYYFKVRGGNGCMPGSWGNTVQAKTTTSVKKISKSYKNTLTAVTSSIRQVFNQSKTNNATSVPNYAGTPQQRAQSPASPRPNQKIAQSDSPDPSSLKTGSLTGQKTNWVTKVVNFVKGIFRF